MADEQTARPRLRPLAPAIGLADLGFLPGGAVYCHAIELRSTLSIDGSCNTVKLEVVNEQRPCPAQNVTSS